MLVRDGSFYLYCPSKKLLFKMFQDFLDRQYAILILFNYWEGYPVSYQIFGRITGIRPTPMPDQLSLEGGVQCTHSTTRDSPLIRY